MMASTSVNTMDFPNLKKIYDTLNVGAEESAGNGVPDNADIDDSDNSSGAEDGV